MNDAINKVRLGLFPTPLQKSSLGADLGDICLYLKRDDLCGIGFGGNKVRKLEYILADAIAKGADCVVTGGGSRSNQTVAAAVCCAKAGLAAHIVMPENGPNVTRSLITLSGGILHTAPDGQTSTLAKTMRNIAKELRSQGHRPCIIPAGASSPLGALGYVEAMEELWGQAAELGIAIDHVICCGGTGNTYAGVALGAKLYSPQTRATVISIGRRFARKETLLRQIHETEALLRLESGIDLDDLHIHFSCGKGAGAPSVRGWEAMERVAAAEGIFLDPYFTGKAFAGLMELAQDGTLRPGENVVFFHTGGMVSLISQTIVK